MGPWALWPLDPGWSWSYLGPKWFFGKLKNKKGPIGPKMGPFGLKLGPNEAKSFPGPYGSPPGPIWAHFGPKNPKMDQNPKIPKNSEIWTLVNIGFYVAYVMQQPHTPIRRV